MRGYNAEEIPTIQTPEEYLRALRAIMQYPSRWCKGFLARGPLGYCGSFKEEIWSCCLYGGLKWLHLESVHNVELWTQAIDLAEKAGMELFPKRAWSLIQFNDHQDTTHEDILRVLDRAIELAREGLPGPE